MSLQAYWGLQTEWNREAARQLNPIIEAFQASGVFVLAGEGSPEGAEKAPVGSLYLRRDGGAGTTLYVKESGTGNTGWAAK